MKAGIGIALAATLALSAVTASSASAAGDGQTKRAKCELKSVQEATSLGASYVDPVIKTRGVSCGKAKRVIKAFNKCRRDRGGADGHCKSRVKGYKCNEGKREGVPDQQYHANVGCKKGSKRIKFGYTMNL